MKVGHTSQFSFLPFLPAALAASNVGVWHFNVAQDLFCYDLTTASLFGLSMADAEHGVPMQRVTEAVHPDDQARHKAQRHYSLKYGGVFVIEYRTVPSPGLVRWVLARGRYEVEPNGSVSGARGIVIDLTESKLDGFAEGRAIFPSHDEGEEGDPLDRIAGHAIAARRAVDELRDAEPLRRAVDALLLQVGRAIAVTFKRGRSD